MVSQSKCLIPGLPNEIAVICLAKVPLRHRHRISRVCRGWRNLFRKEYFWAVRREHSACETLLLIWTGNLYKAGVWHGLYPATRRWIKLPLMPSDNRFKGFSTFAVVDEKLFVLGGMNIGFKWKTSGSMSSKVSYFDLKRWEWNETAPLNVARCYCMAGALNGHLYIFGGQTDQGSTPTAEVYNPVTKTWKFVSSMPASMIRTSSVVVDGKVYAVSEAVSAETYISDWKQKGVVYSPQEDAWTQMSQELNSGWTNHAVEFQGKICVRRDSIASFAFESCVVGYDGNENTWKLIHGRKIIENELPFLRFPQLCCDFGGRLVNLDGNLCFVSQNTSGKRLKFEIRDMTRRRLASKSIRFSVLAGTEDSQIERPQHQGVTETYLECETVRL